MLNGSEIISLPGGATLTNNAVYCIRKSSSGGHVSVISHKRISLKIFFSSKNFFTGNLGSSTTPLLHRGVVGFRL